jgi:hypothetical protein
MIPFLIWGSTSAQEIESEDSGVLLTNHQAQVKVSEIEEKIDAQIFATERHIHEIDLLICALERMEADSRLPAPLQPTDPRPPLRPLPLPLPRPPG